VQEVIVTTEQHYQNFLKHLSNCVAFGFDTEFIGEETYHPRLCLVQVATPDTLYVLDPLSLDSLDAFWEMVIDPARVTIVHAGREEIRLCQLWGKKSPGNLVDLQIAAGLTGLPYPLGHGNLVNLVLGTQIAKGETLTDWRRRPLTPEQIEYAFDDVRYLMRLWDKLSGKLLELGRGGWLVEEVDRLCNVVNPGEPTAVEKWRKLRGSGGLDRKRLGVLRALFQWREEQAVVTNRPVRSIVRDDLLVEIAKRNPTRSRDLSVVRGLPRRYQDEILAVVEQARTLPSSQLPSLTEREQETPQLNWLCGILNAYLGCWCLRQKLASNLVASNQDVRNLVRQKLGMRAEDPILKQGWRAQHVLPDLLDVLEGRRSLRIGNLRSETPLEMDNPGGG
jgi:ribonuclease D